jgi:hypothetical protein
MYVGCGFTIRRVCVFAPARIARTIGAENRIGRSRIVVSPVAVLAPIFAARGGFVGQPVIRAGAHAVDEAGDPYGQPNDACAEKVVGCRRKRGEGV